MLKEKWIAYTIPCDDTTINIASFDSQLEAMFWFDEHLECRPDGYYLDGNKVFCKKTYKLYT